MALWVNLVNRTSICGGWQVVDQLTIKRTLAWMESWSLDLHVKALSREKLKLTNFKTLPISCFHTTNLNTLQPRYQDSFFLRKEERGPCKSCSKRSHVKCKFANSEKLARIETSLFFSSSFSQSHACLFVIFFKSYLWAVTICNHCYLCSLIPKAVTFFTQPYKMLTLRPCCSSSACQQMSTLESRTLLTELRCTWLWTRARR